MLKNQKSNSVALLRIGTLFILIAFIYCQSQWRTSCVQCLFHGYQHCNVSSSNAQVCATSITASSCKQTVSLTFDQCVGGNDDICNSNFTITQRKNQTFDFAVGPLQYCLVAVKNTAGTDMSLEVNKVQTNLYPYPLLYSKTTSILKKDLATLNKTLFIPAGDGQAVMIISNDSLPKTFKVTLYKDAIYLQSLLINSLILSALLLTLM
ncbi:UNKNOWN [Stylonychia lemnae]|uniref:Transmembrane protein n=1 Tax=Stylonychia lemnae TaxID=5949 RepID=A0A078A668_STYLE|nr:UNKNOWN [Stylonychia lemnae]|eukprot:CDW77060.1 UNKNOWN [Stylonychia lemnae]